MAFEVKPVCVSCPLVYNCVSVVNVLEQQADELYMDLLTKGDDELSLQAAELTEAGFFWTRPNDDLSDYVQEPITPDKLRLMKEQELDGAKQGIQMYEGIMERSTAECIGALVFRRDIDAETVEEVSLCQSGEQDNIVEMEVDGNAEAAKEQDVQVPADDGARIRMALVRRVITKKSAIEADATPETE